MQTRQFRYHPAEARGTAYKTLGGSLLRTLELLNGPESESHLALPVRDQAHGGGKGRGGRTGLSFFTMRQQVVNVRLLSAALSKKGSAGCTRTAHPRRTSWPQLPSLPLPKHFSRGSAQTDLRIHGTGSLAGLDLLRLCRGPESAAWKRTHMHTG